MVHPKGTNAQSVKIGQISPRNFEFMIRYFSFPSHHLLPMHAYVRVIYGHSKINVVQSNRIYNLKSFTYFSEPAFKDAFGRGEV